jgi:predicted nucleotide-binding protein/SAM-dependent methyltransferase
LVTERARRIGTAADPAFTRKVFFASTSETLRAPWFAEFLAMLTEWLRAHPNIDWQHWNGSFPANNRPTLEQLLVICHDFDAAVCVLSGDDLIEMRGQVQNAPRDNLLFEAGLFLSAFGLSNVLIIQEEESKIAADFFGIATGRYRLDQKRQALAPNSDGRRLIDVVTEFLQQLDTHGGVPDPGLFSFLKEATNRLDDFRVAIQADSLSGPLKTGSAGSHEVAYKHALRNTRERFWTTTYLNSAFWSRNNDIIIEANRELGSRLRRGRLGGRSRLIRLVLLDNSPEQALEELRRRMRAERQLGPQFFDIYCQDLRHRLERLRYLRDLGFDVKVVYDADADHGVLRGPPISYQHSYTEIALYDAARIDVFRGMDEIESITSACDGFDGTHSMVEGWIIRLLESPQQEDFAKFHDSIKKMIDAERDRIDYEQNWLFTYDHNDGELERLKKDELEFVVAHLQATGFSGGHVLDVGTRTGRYLLALAQLYPGAQLIGIDNDEECVDYFKKAKLKTVADSAAHRIRVMLADITEPRTLSRVDGGGHYDLITAMMGTLQHLRADRPAGGGDDLDQAISHMRKMLKTDGSLFVSVWRNNLRTGNSDVLDIYTPATKATLMRRFFSERQWEQRFADNGLEIVNKESLRGKLLVMHLRQKLA